MAEATLHSTTPSIDYVAVKNKQRQTWGAGDYAQVGATLQIVGEHLAESLEVYAGQQVLDVAAGNGNFSMAAARRAALVTASDFVPGLLEKGRIRALADGFDITFETADAEDLPFAEASFDVAASVFGIMFTPNQMQSAAEIARVVRPGGKIGLANWTPNGFIGQLFKTLGQYLPNPLPSPALWGTADHLQRLFGEHVAGISMQRKFFHFHYLTPEAWLENFKTVYGPVKNAFAALDDHGQKALQQDILDLLTRLNQGQNGTMKVPGEYLEVVITKA
ncbi:MAG: methyltransferase domain-containing protein [Pseudomonadota bacterium]